MLALSIAVARPSVHVDADAAGDELRGWLLVRLSEEGFELVPTSAGAEVDLRVARDDEGWIVDAEGADRQSYRVTEGPGSVQRLEVLHRAVAAVEEVVARPFEPSQTPRVAIELGAGGDLEARDRIAAEVTLAVLAAGGRVVAAGAPYDRVVCATPRDDTGFALASGEGSCEAAEVVAIADTPGWVAHALAPAPGDVLPPDPSAAEEAAPPAPLEETASSREEVPTRERQTERPGPSPPPAEPDRTAKERRPVLRIGARGGLVARTGPVDPAVGVDLRLGRAVGPTAWIDAQVWPSRAGPLRIVDAVPAAGLRWRFDVHDRVSLDVGALLGLAVHTWSVTGSSEVPAGRRAGRRFDVSGELAGALGLRIVRSLQLELELRGGLTGRARTHLLGVDDAWSRSAWRIVAYGGLGWTFDLRQTR